MWHREPPLPAELRAHLDALGTVAESALHEAGHKESGQNQGHWRHAWRFGSEPAAERWNDAWDEVLTQRNTLHPAFCEVAKGYGCDVFLDALARLCGAIVSEEIHAGAPCPYMGEGWSYALRFEHTLHADTSIDLPQPWVVKLSGHVFGPGDDLHWTADATRIYPAEWVPRALVGMWSHNALPEAETDFL